tara:strand:+ start:790 stop:1029 length:240 start_codon:yes stop_codon:yes gene_type:complete
MFNKKGVVDMNNCEDCKGKGWVIADGRLGDEIQYCQTCCDNGNPICKSDKEAYQKASLEIDVSNYKYDTFAFTNEEGVA